MAKKTEREQIESIIANPKTTESEKEKFRKVLEKMDTNPKERKAEVIAVKGKSGTGKSHPPINKSKQVDLGYNCDDLIAEQKEKVKKANEAKKKRESEPVKTPVTKAKEKIEKVEDDVMKRVESGKATKSEIMKLIKEAEHLLGTLKKALDKIK